MCGSWNSTMSGDNSSSSPGSSRRSSVGDERQSLNSTNPNDKISKVNCIICLESYTAKDKLSGGTCGHVFHSNCIQRWNQTSEQCPTCRCTNATYSPIYLNFEEVEMCPSEPQSLCQSNEYELLLYETQIYRDEIKHLTDRINNLELASNLGIDLNSDSE